MIRPTIYQKLRERLGREPTHRELVDEVARIIAEVRRVLDGESDDPARRSAPLHS